MADLLPPQACAIVVPAAESSAPTCLIGLAVHSDEAALAALEAAMKKRGVRGGRVSDSPSPEVMAIFVRSEQSVVFALFRDAVSGKFGKLQVEVMVSPASTAADGIDLDTEVTANPPDYLRLPSE